jgi:hypothetical protein
MGFDPQPFSPFVESGQFSNLTSHAAAFNGITIRYEQKQYLT